MSFVCGNAYLLKCYFTQPRPKNKYALCVCEEKPLFFLISTSPRKCYNPDSQLEVTQTDLSFLAHDSYVNTGEVITCIIDSSCDVLKDYGPMPHVLRERIKSTVVKSDTLSKRFINTILSKL